MTRVCHVVLRHDPRDGRVFHKEALSLAAHGYAVKIAVPQISGEGLGWKGEVPAGKEAETKEQGITFIPYPYRKALPKVFGIRQRAARRALLETLVRIDAGIYHFHEDGLIMEAAVALKEQLPDKKVVFDFHESYPDHYQETPRKRKALPGYLSLENRLLEKADLIITVSDVLTSRYTERTAAPVVTVMNCQSEKLFTPWRKALDDREVFWVGHEGRLGFNRGLKLILETARQVREPGIRFLMVGEVPKKEAAFFRETASRYGLTERFHLTGRVPYEEVGNYLSVCRAGIDFRTSQNAQAGVANKFFNYLRFGIPVLALPNQCTDSIIQDRKVGMVVRSDDPAGIARLIEGLYRDPARQNQLARNAHRAFKETYNWERMEGRLVEAYRGL
jgi:glycosyltransferase involved in cell wall biosynthesis